MLPLWDRLGNHYSLAPTLIHKLTPWSILPKPKNEHNVFLCHDTAKKVVYILYMLVGTDKSEFFFHNFNLILQEEIASFFSMQQHFLSK